MVVLLPLLVFCICIRRVYLFINTIPVYLSKKKKKKSMCYNRRNVTEPKDLRVSIAMSLEGRREFPVANIIEFKVIVC